MAKKLQGGSAGIAIIVAVVVLGGIGFVLTQDFKTGHNRLADYGQAMKGDAESQYQQGLKLLGSRAPGDADKAQVWLEKAAGQGSVKAMLALGDLHNASTTEADGDAAMMWYKKAAQAGNIEAKRKLGIGFDIGRGRMEPDHEAAMAQFEAAASAGDVPAQRLYGAQLAFRQRFAEAQTWWLEAADKGDIAAEAALGDLYYAGRGGLKDYAKAFDWLGKAAEAGDMESQLTYSYMYYSGRGVKKDKAEAYKWVNLANDTGQMKAQMKAKAARDYLAEYLTDAEIAEGKARAARWRAAHRKS